jgi:hypothetical protein
MAYEDFWLEPDKAYITESNVILPPTRLPVDRDLPLNDFDIRGPFRASEIREIVDRDNLTFAGQPEWLAGVWPNV